MVIKVGINGFGRVGRVIFRTFLQNPDLEIAAINDPAIEVDYIAYLMKFDSTHGRLKATVTYTQDEVKIDEKSIKIFRQKHPNSIPWSAAGVSYVVESSGMFTNMEKASGHLDSETVKRVIVTAPSLDVPMMIIGVNENTIEIENRVISCGSSTLYCLAPIVKVLEDSFGVDAGFITSIHAMTPSLKPLDGLCLRGKHWRDHRSIVQNIIPATTGACKALGKIIPQVRDKITGLAFRVPIVNVSVLDLTIRLQKPTTLFEIIRNVDRASKSSMKDIITISKDETVSTDYMGDSHSCILDADSSIQLKPNFYKLICWYENEFSYACRVVDLIHLSERQFLEIQIKKMEFLNKNNKKPLMGLDEVQQTEVAVKCDIGKELDLNKKNELPYQCGVKDLPKKTIKPFARAAISRKPWALPENPKFLPAVNNSTPSKKLMETIQTNQSKVWKDGSNDTASAGIVRQTRGSFFQTCHMTEDRPQQGLEKIKKEFSKMVGITEQLLKKSNNKSQLGLDLSKNELSVDDLDSIKTIGTVSQVDQSSVNVRGQSMTVEVDTSGDRLSSECTSICRDFSKDNVKNLYKNISDISIPDFKIRDIPILPGESTIKLGQSSLSVGPSHLTLEETPTETSNEAMSSESSLLRGGAKSKMTCGSPNTFKNHLSRTFSSIKKSFHFQPINSPVSLVATRDDDKSNEVKSKKDKEFDSKEKECDSKEKEFDLKDKEFNTKEKELNLDVKSPPTKNNSYNTESPGLVTIKIAPLQQDGDSNKNSEPVDLKKLPGINRLDIHLRNRNIVIIDETAPTESKARICSSDEGSVKDENVKNADGESSASPLSPLSPTSPLSPSSLNSPLTFDALSAVKKLDIYDKLDSPSGTDSETSLQGKKSAVIHISDLTNSLDDLERLDKICRIIEISDELSDKLFSPLGTASDSKHKKRWSFKDLCDKIHLDEFCTQVFGK